MSLRSLWFFPYGSVVSICYIIHPTNSKNSPAISKTKNTTSINLIFLPSISFLFFFPPTQKCRYTPVRPLNQLASWRIAETIDYGKETRKKQMPVKFRAENEISVQIKQKQPQQSALDFASSSRSKFEELKLFLNGRLRVYRFTFLTFR